MAREQRAEEEDEGPRVVIDMPEEIR